jgi:hypothetical protein
MIISRFFGNIIQLLVCGVTQEMLKMEMKRLG